MENNKKIKILLHHDYLQIEHNGETIQCPVRCAKLIHDMYDVRNAENERADIRKYSLTSDGMDNYEYELSVYNMSKKIHPDSPFEWLHTIVKPIDPKE